MEIYFNSVKKKNQPFAQHESLLTYRLPQESSDALMDVLGYTGWYSFFSGTQQGFPLPRYVSHVYFNT